MADDTLNSQDEAMRLTDWKGIRSIFPTEFQDALANNCPPRPGVLQIARAFRENSTFASTAAQRRIEAIDEQMKMLQAERDQLADKDNMQAAVAEACTALCAPIRRVTDEILLEIARYSVHDHPSPLTAPTLTHISSAWRTIVTKSPTLWTTLYLRISTVKDVAYLAKRAQVVNTWFQRASSLPLTLFLYVDNTDRSPNAEYVLSQFLKAIAHWTPRLYRLGIGGHNMARLMANFVDIEWDLCNLQELDILGQSIPDMATLAKDMARLVSLQEQLVLLQSAKRLVSVVASEEVTTFLESFAFIPWGQVLHVAMNENLPSGSELNDLFVKCPNLRTAFFSWLNPNFFDIGHHHTNLEKLELFHIHISNYSELVSFLTKITCPRLTHLAISIARIGNLEEVYTTIAMAPFESLLFLYLDGRELPTEFVVDFLWKMPRLQILSMELALRHNNRSATDLNQLCRAMTINANTYDFLPFLEECTFKRPEHLRPVLLDVTIISQFISSRAQHDLAHSGSSCLKKISFLGRFLFMTDLHEEIIRISSEKLPTEIVILEDDQIPWSSDPNRQLDFQRTPFCLEKCYDDNPYCE